MNKNQITHSSTSRYVKRMMKKGLIEKDGNKLKVNEQKMEKCQQLEKETKQIQLMEEKEKQKNQREKQIKKNQ